MLLFLLRYLLAVNPLLEIHRGGGQNNPPVGPTVESVTISRTEVTLEVGAKYTLEASILPAEMDTGVLWKSADKSVVSVTETGEITAHKAGSANVTATAKADTSKTAVCKVTVVNKGDGTPATSITLSAKVLDLGFGETKLLSVTVSPDNAVMPELTWSSDNDTIVKVDNGKVTGIKEGVATVIVSTVTGELTDSCQVTVTRNGIEGDWQTDWDRYFITAETITTYIHEAGGTGSIPQNRYSYTKSGNGIEGTVTVTLQSIWNNVDNKWYTVDEYIEVMIKQIQESMSGSLRDFVASMSGGDLSLFISKSKDMAAEMNMTFDESNLTEANLDKPVPQDVQNLYTTAYANKFFTAKKEKMTRPRTYEYEVTDDGGTPPMIQFTGMYDTTKKWFEQTAGSFSTYDNGISISYDPQSKSLYRWDQNTQTNTNIFFSSVTETSLTEQDSGKTWTASWNGNTLTLKSEDISYELTWSGYSL